MELPEWLVLLVGKLVIENEALKAHVTELEAQTKDRPSEPEEE